MLEISLITFFLAPHLLLWPCQGCFVKLYHAYEGVVYIGSTKSSFTICLDSLHTPWVTWWKWNTKCKATSFISSSMLVIVYTTQESTQSGGCLQKINFTIISDKIFLGLNIFLLFPSKKFHSDYQNCHIEHSQNVNALGKLLHTSKFKREGQDIVPISLGPTMTISCAFHSFQISQSFFNFFVFMGKM